MNSRVLIDIKPRWRIKSRRASSILNLSRDNSLRIPIKSILKAGLVCATAFSFIFGFVLAPTGSIKYIDVSKAAQNDAQRQALEAQLSQIEKEISDREAAIEQYRAQGKTLQSEIKRLEGQISKLNLQIRDIDLNLQQLDQEINQTQDQINQTQDQIDQNKVSIAAILQTVYENDKTGLVEVLLKHPNLSDFFSDLNNLVTVQSSLRDVLNKSVQLKEDLTNQQQTLALERSDNQSLKDYEDAQRQSIQQVQQQKSDLFQETKGKESAYQKIVQEQKKTAAQIRMQIFQLLGGGQLEFGDAYKLAKVAGDATGVRPALILAILDRESALGQNVGKCDYESAMNPSRDVPAFLSIAQSLGLQNELNQGTLKVSCPNRDGLYGGAMGPAQFLPSTWLLYSDRIAAISGHNPPSPWSNADAFVATALYLKDVGADSTSISQERIAAAKYYAGTRWRRFVWTYGDRVVSQAQQFESDIAILNS